MGGQGWQAFGAHNATTFTKIPHDIDPISNHRIRQCINFSPGVCWIPGISKSVLTIMLCCFMDQPLFSSSPHWTIIKIYNTAIEPSWNDRPTMMKPPLNQYSTSQMDVLIYPRSAPWLPRCGSWFGWSSCRRSVGVVWPCSGADGRGQYWPWQAAVTQTKSKLHINIFHW